MLPTGMQINLKNIILCLFVIVSDQEEPDVPMLSLACLCSVYVCGLKKVGSRIARGQVGLASGRWESLL
jgi:hypothetical protein